MRRLLARCWLWSWVLTLPATLLFGYWGLSLWQDYRAFQLRYVTAMPYDLHGQGVEHFDQLLRSLGHKVWPRADASPLRQVSLFVPQGSLQRLDGHLPHSGFDYVPGALQVDGVLQPVDLRYRGDFLLHWAWPKKSWRIKTDRQELFDGMRRFNLIAPKFATQVNDHLGYSLARHLGVMAPHTEMVQVTLNGHAWGLHMLVEQPDESTLRRLGRMPGDLFSGDFVARDHFAELSNAVFDQPGLWEKRAVNNHFDPDARRPLEELAALVNRPVDADTHRRLGELLDLEAFARLAAFETLAQSVHTGSSHNWRLFWDPWRTRFEPLVWDPNAWAAHWQAELPIHLEPNPSRLHELLLGNGRFLAAREACLREFLEGPARQEFLAEAQRTVAAARSALVSDPHPRPADRGDIERAMAHLPSHLERVFATVAEAYGPGSLRWDAADDGSLHLRLAGRRSLRRLALDGDPADTPDAPTLVYRRHGREHRVPLTGARDGTGRLVLDLHLPAQLWPAPRMSALGLAEWSHAAKGTDVRIEGLAEPRRVLADFGDGWSAAERAADLRAQLPLDHLDPVLQPPAAPTEWSGQRTIEGLVEIPGDLRIAPGTELRMAPGASVLVRGRVEALGTASEPIRFVPTDPETPWGCLALVGRGADGSQLRHCSFAHGSGLKSPLGMFEYSGLLSIHDVRQVRIEHCTFADSLVVDDMLHAVYSELRMEHCSFTRALSDAVDLDHCRATLADCAFLQSGNDGLDLMSSRVLVQGSTFRNNGDKGISVGEDSDLVVLGSTFRDGNLGIQIKDGSRCVAAHCEFIGHSLALNAYQKNWRYGDGGQGTVLASVFRVNAGRATADQRSRLRLVDCFVTPESADGSNVRSEGCDDQEEGKARGIPFELPRELREAIPGAEEAWSRRDASRRGHGSG